MNLPRICGGFLNLTQRCNLKCRYCFVHQQPKEMTYETAKDAVDFYARNAVLEATEPQVTFFGGEPMLKYEEIIKPLVEYIRSTYGDYNISITTNGTLLNEEVYEFFKENDVGMLLSLDGMKEIQDYNRPYHSGRGSFDDIDIKMHLKYYPGGTFRATVDPDTVHLLYENYLWGEGQGFTNCAFILNSFAYWSDEKLLILEKEINKVANHIIRNKEENKPFMSFNEFDKFNDDMDFLKNVDKNYFRDREQRSPACGSCGLGAGMYGSVGSSGNIYSCQELTENEDTSNFIIGNIYTGMKKDAREKIVSAFNTKNVKCDDNERCKTCKIYPICKGGCVINNYLKHGSLEIMDKALCFYYEKCFEMQKLIRGEI